MSPGPIFFILTQYLEIDWLHRPTFDVGRIGQNSMELIGGIVGPRATSLVERHDRAQATQEPQSAASARGLPPPPLDAGLWPRTGNIDRQSDDSGKSESVRVNIGVHHIMK